MIAIVLKDDRIIFCIQYINYTSSNQMSDFQKEQTHQVVSNDQIQYQYEEQADHHPEHYQQKGEWGQFPEEGLQPSDVQHESQKQSEKEEVSQKEDKSCSESMNQQELSETEQNQHSQAQNQNQKNYEQQSNLEAYHQYGETYSKPDNEVQLSSQISISQNQVQEVEQPQFYEENLTESDFKKMDCGSQPGEELDIQNFGELQIEKKAYSECLQLKAEQQFQENQLQQQKERTQTEQYCQSKSPQKELQQQQKEDQQEQQTEEVSKQNLQKQAVVVLAVDQPENPRQQLVEKKVEQKIENTQNEAQLTSKQQNQQQNLKQTTKKVKKVKKNKKKEKIQQEIKPQNNKLEQLPAEQKVLPMLAGSSKNQGKQQKNLSQQRVSNDPPTDDPKEPIKVESSLSQQAPHHQENLDSNINIESLIVPVMSSTVIIKAAEKQRILTTYNLFRKYAEEHQKTVNSYKLIIKNILQQFEERKQKKKELLESLKDYFVMYAKMIDEFYEKTHKINFQQKEASSNPFANIKDQFKSGFNQLSYLRKSIANDFHKMSIFIASLISKLFKVFEQYFEGLGTEEKSMSIKKDQFVGRQKFFKKALKRLDEILLKSTKKERKEDVYVQIVKFISEEKLYRQTLKKWGRGLLSIRKNYINCENVLMEKLQQELNTFKTQSLQVYSFCKKSFFKVQQMNVQIKKASTFNQLCTITDLDYIRYVLELQNKKQQTKFTNKHFEEYLELPFFEKIVGDVHNLLKGATSKVFPLEIANEELIHTISGHLIHYNHNSEECKDTFVIKNLSAKIVSQGVVEFDQLLKGIFFDDNRTLRFRLKDSDRAEELICYLNEKLEGVMINNA